MHFLSFISSWQSQIGLILKPSCLSNPLIPSDHGNLHFWETCNHLSEQSLVVVGEWNKEFWHFVKSLKKCLRKNEHSKESFCLTLVQHISLCSRNSNLSFEAIWRPLPARFCAFWRPRTFQPPCAAPCFAVIRPYYKVVLALRDDDLPEAINARPT